MTPRKRFRGPLRPVSPAFAGMTLIISFLSFSFGAGTTAGRFLIFPGEARGMGMAEAYSAATSGVNALWYNPATLSRNPFMSVSVMHTLFLEGISFSTLGAAYPLKKQQAVGLGIRYLSAGSIKSFDKTGALAPAFTPKDIAVSFAYARTFRTVSVGVAAKRVQTTISESASTFALDAGVHKEMGPFSVGLAAENFGGSLSFQKEAHALPQRARGGISWRLNPAWLINAETLFPLEDSPWFAAGAEYSTQLEEEVGFALRGGYNTKGQGEIKGLHGLAAGFGVSYHDATFNYAWVPFGDLGQTHRFSINYQMKNPFIPQEDSIQRYAYGSKLAQSRREGLVYIQKPALSKLGREAQKMPLRPWKDKIHARRSADENVMDSLSREPLCSSNSPQSLVMDRRGSVTFRSNPDQKKWIKLHNNKYLFEGESLRTKKKSYAHLLYANGTRMEVGPHSKMTIHKSSDVCLKPVIDLKTGNLYTITKEGREFVIKTPFGEADLKKSESELFLNDDFLHLRLLSGRINFIVNGATYSLRSGESLTRDKERTIRQSIAYEQEQLRQSTTPYAGSGWEFDKKQKKRIKKLKKKAPPNRWNEDTLSQYAKFIEEINSIPELQLKEYSREKIMRDEINHHLTALTERKLDLNTQRDAFDADIKNFGALMAELKKKNPQDTRADRRLKKKQLKNARKIIRQARKSLRKIRRLLRDILNDFQFNREYLASIPISRMLNITAIDSTIPFKTAKAKIPESAYPILNRIAEAAQDLKPFHIVVEGHTDKTGSVRGNKRLSKKRAKAVAKYLKKRTNLHWGTFKIRGMGSSKPLEEGDTSEAFAKNRRVEIWFELKGL